MQLHLSKRPLGPGEAGTPPRVVGLSYAIQPQVPYDDNACPVFGTGVATHHSDTFSTSVEIMVPETPEVYVPFLTQPPPPGRRADRRDDRRRQSQGQGQKGRRAL